MPRRRLPLVIFIGDDARLASDVQRHVARTAVFKQCKHLQDLTRHLPASAVVVLDYTSIDTWHGEAVSSVNENAPDTVRIAIVSTKNMELAMRDASNGWLARYIVRPCDSTTLRHALTWGLEASELMRDSPAMFARLMQTERLSTLGHMSGTILHDLRQPLAYMQGNADRLHTLGAAMPLLSNLLASCSAKRERPGWSAATQALHDLVEDLPDIAQDMLAGCEAMEGIVSSMQRLLRPHDERDAATSDPLAVVQYAMSVCKRIAAEGRGEVQYLGPATLPKLRIGPTALTQIFVNVVANAAQALCRRPTPGGRLLVEAQAGDATVRFIIKDDGPGMSAEVLSRVGIPFFSTRQDGTGLGVSQSRRLVESQGGEFKIHSREGAGTTVTFTLPKA